MAETIRAAFRESGLSMKRLTIEADVPYAATHGFFAGSRDCTLTTAEKWCDVLGLELVQRAKRKGAR